MIIKLVIFLVSILMFAALLYIVGGIWFRGKRTAYLRLFFTMGILYAVWALFNGFNVLLSEEMYTLIYPCVLIVACILPSITLRYILYFTESRYATSRWISWVLTILPAADCVMLITNPLHNAFIASYDGIRPIPGSLFPIHAILSYIPLVISLIILVRYVVKNFKKTPALGYILAVYLLPTVLNLLYTFNVFGAEFDVTPFAFVFMFGVFALYSIQLRLFDNKETAVTALFNSLSDALLVADFAGYVSDCNPAFKHVFPDAPLSDGKSHISDLVNHIKSLTTDYSPLDIFGRLLTDDAASIAGEISMTVDGDTAHFSVAKDIIMQRGQYAGFIITFSNISNYRRMIAEINEQNITLTRLKNLAESASNAKSLFLANMSHEIRTPLNAITGMTQIARAAGDATKVEQCLDKISSASKHLLGVINDILDMSKIEASQFELYEEKINFMKVINNVITISSAQTEEKNQQLKVSVDDDIPAYVIADELRLSQVVNNLLSNAVKFTPSGGTIILAVKQLERNGDTVRLEFSVEDNGIGIDGAQLGGLFNAFEQADSSISKKYGGTGLGLSISQRIVELMGGHIHVDSTVGKGSRFTFNVCVRVAEQDTANETADEITAVNFDFSGCTILLVEDIEINREIVVTLVESIGAQVECAENGQLAVEMFAANPARYDLIYMDVHMPVMDGYTATREIRKLDNPRASTVPIIAMTANAFAEDVTKSLEAGMNDHISKPFELEEFYQKTARHIKST